MTDHAKLDQDDFYLSPTGSQSARDFYDSFLKCKELYSHIPKSVVKATPEVSFYKLLKELNSPSANQPALYRRRPTADDSLCALWLSKVKAISRLFTLMNAVPEFKGLDHGKLEEIARLSADENNITKLASLLFELGIIVVYEASLPGMKLDGAAYLTESGNPVIALSLRYPRLDHFWFTLMHELAHVSLHYKALSTPIIDNLDEESDDIQEKEADRLALNSFISRSAWRSCPPKYDLKESVVIEFAMQQGIHPAIVAGRLHRELNRHNLFVRLVNSVNVRKVLLGHE